jgi:ketosteroid isomerase-like protein
MPEHRNLSLVREAGKAIQAGTIRDAAGVFAEGVVWHYFNPRLPMLAGDYAGIDGIATFFEKVAQHTNGTFRMQPVSATPIGDELVVTHARLALTLAGRPIETDVVVVWRVQGGRIAEVWDIPAAHMDAEPRAAAV